MISYHSLSFPESVENRLWRPLLFPAEETLAFPRPKPKMLLRG
jgi:hypothetical protein